MCRNEGKLYARYTGFDVFHSGCKILQEIASHGFQILKCIRVI